MSFDLVLLVFEEILLLDVDISLSQPCDGMELLTVILLVEVHAMREHLLKVTNPNWIPGTKQAAVNFKSCGVGIVEAPDPYMVHEELEVSTSLEVE